MFWESLLMPDPRYKQLANLLVNHSCSLKKGDKILVEATEIPDAFLSVLTDEILAAGALPVVDRKDERLNRVLLKSGSEEQLADRLRLQADIELHRMKQMDAYLGEATTSRNSPTFRRNG